MSAYNPAYNPAGYLTDVYDQYVLCHWTPDPNQAFYAPSISQEIPPGWHHLPAFPADGNNPCMYPREYSAALPNPAYLLPAHYYAYPPPFSLLHHSSALHHSPLL
ncbi:hypothetical protein E4T56_gene20022 [Termitomyces sp. T112]|nr:hypothetical protein E4T56_gene20022 [Termitomyces sp. T112]